MHTVASVLECLRLSDATLPDLLITMATGCFYLLAVINISTHIHQCLSSAFFFFKENTSHLCGYEVLLECGFNLHFLELNKTLN